ncbi:hypothetical protein KY335_03395 [Candidatus Woesearchaeota archaeon]|nr:hypothetical protein [Candidatus Woesearchaeota archaeon]MBW3014262.1 hypothetical protein [Candidatus Woesearchaeota archaeon]
MEEEKVSRLEFEHFIAEFEAFRDAVMDELSKLTQATEILEDDLKDLKQKLQEEAAVGAGQSRLI